MKKFLSLLLTAMIILTFTSFPAFAADFSEYLTAEVNPDGVANTTTGDSLIPASENYLNGLYFQGIQIRKTENTGLRFIFARSLELEEAIKAEIPDTTFEVKYLVSLTSTLGNEELNVGNAKVNEKVANIYRTSPQLTAGGKDPEGYEKFTVCITGLRVKEYLNTMISVRPYITYTDSQGQSQILYGEQVDCSIYMGAKGVYDESTNESDREWLSENILSLIEIGDNDITTDSIFPAAPTLVFEDNFDGTSLNTSNWSYCPESTRGNGASIWKSNRVSVSGGNLVLDMYWNGSMVECGAIRSKDKAEYGYGYYEVRAKVPVEHNGAWFAFWLMQGEPEYKTGLGGKGVEGAQDGIEIDIIETIDNYHKDYRHNLFWDCDYKAGTNTNFWPGIPAANRVNIYDGNYHTFGLLLNEEGYTFYIDGKVSRRVKDGDADNEGDVISALDKDVTGYMKLTCEANASDWSLAAPGTLADIGSKQVYVDYVRVYEDLPYWID